MLTLRGVTLLGFLYWLISFKFCHGLDIFQEKRIVNSSELCIIPITPNLFNWEKTADSVNEIEYSARTSNSPDLPDWLQYTYDGKDSVGFLYGVPPANVDSVSIDVIAWNHYDDYEVRMLIISLEIIKRARDAFTVEMKIDNMNVKDLCSRSVMNRVQGIFSRYLNWTYSDGLNVHPVYLASAVELGENRIPLRPTDAEGVVIHFSSDQNFSKVLLKLEEEVMKLPKLKPCPRDMKRTSMERYFRSQRVLVDWCSFRLNTITPPDETANNNPVETNPVSGYNDAQDDDIFYFRTEIPEKSYGSGILLATVVPGAIGGLVGFLLLALLWNDRDEEAVFRKQKYEEQETQSSTHEQNDDQEGYVGIITRDRNETNGNGGREAMHTPLPPQYAETHPNGSPALIYAV